MSSQTSSKSTKSVLVTVVIVLSVIFSFTAGYLVGSLETGEGRGFTVVDDYGRVVSLRGIPERIVSVSPSPTEILFAIGAGPQIVGVDNMSDYPAEAVELPKVGSYYLNLEAIVALQPDLIVSSDFVPEAQLKQLESQGYPYILLADRTVEAVLKTIKLAGVVTGHIEEANEVADALAVRINAVTNLTLASGVSKPMVYIEYDDYLGYWTFGPGSYGDDLIRCSGGENAAHNASKEYACVGSEFIVAKNPDVIIYTTGSWSTLSKDTYLNRTGWETITAVQDGTIYGMDANLIDRYGPRVVDCLEQMAALVHPELFT